MFEQPELKKYFTSMLEEVTSDPNEQFRIYRACYNAAINVLFDEWLLGCTGAIPSAVEGRGHSIRSGELQ